MGLESKRLSKVVRGNLCSPSSHFPQCGGTSISATLLASLTSCRRTEFSLVPWWRNAQSQLRPCFPPFSPERRTGGRSGISLWGRLVCALTLAVVGSHVETHDVWHACLPLRFRYSRNVCSTSQLLQRLQLMSLFKLPKILFSFREETKG